MCELQTVFFPLLNVWTNRLLSFPRVWRGWCEPRGQGICVDVALAVVFLEENQNEIIFGQFLDTQSLTRENFNNNIQITV